MIRRKVLETLYGSIRWKECTGLTSSIFCTTWSRRSLATLRRPRQYEGRVSVAAGSMPQFGKLQEPYQPKEDNIDEYLKKTSLSPWAPIPDSVARKMMDIAQAGPDDVHVDLGSGDGRVNFHAIDYGVTKSIGIDIDESIMQVAKDRLSKRHPQPDIQFIIADLMNENDPVWEQVQQATILTMYFAEEALQTFRPILERKLTGKRMKIITCGYEIPGWISRLDEVVLGTRIHLYEWGKPIEEDDGADLFIGDDIVEQGSDEFMQNHLEGNKFAGSNVIDHTGKYSIRGYNPNLIHEEEDDDEDWDAIVSDSDDETEKSDNDTQVTTKKRL